MDLPITQEQLDRWHNGQGLIQEVFPHLSKEQREFLMTGATQEEWDNEFGEEDEDVAVPCVDGTENHNWVRNDEDEDDCYCDRCGAREY